MIENPLGRIQLALWHHNGQSLFVNCRGWGKHNHCTLTSEVDVFPSFLEELVGEELWGTLRLMGWLSSVTNFSKHLVWPWVFPLSPYVSLLCTWEDQIRFSFVRIPFPLFQFVLFDGCFLWRAAYLLFPLIQMTTVLLKNGSLTIALTVAPSQMCVCGCVFVSFLLPPPPLIVFVAWQANLFSARCVLKRIVYFEHWNRKPAPQMQWYFEWVKGKQRGMLLFDIVRTNGGWQVQAICCGSIFFQQQAWRCQRELPGHGGNLPYIKVRARGCMNCSGVTFAKMYRPASQVWYHSLNVSVK